MEGFWPVFYLAVILKIPVIFAVWLVWWALRSYDNPELPPDGGGGGPKRPQPSPSRPRRPRRGAHAEDLRTPVRAPSRSRAREPQRPARRTPSKPGADSAEHPPRPR